MGETGGRAVWLGFGDAKMAPLLAVVRISADAASSCPSPVPEPGCESGSGWPLLRIWAALTNVPG